MNEIAGTKYVVTITSPKSHDDVDHRRPRAGFVKARLDAARAKPLKRNRNSRQSDEPNRQCGAVELEMREVDPNRSPRRCGQGTAKGAEKQEPEPYKDTHCCTDSPNVAFDHNPTRHVLPH